MPSLIDIRRRIRSVKNMQQITKAMKMVSAAKLRRAQERAIASRPYARIMQRMLSNIAAAAVGNEEVTELPLLQVREEKRIQLIVVSSDTGLAGAFNSNLLRSAQKFVDDNSGADLRVETIGRKSRDYFRKRKYNVSGEYVGIVEKPKIEQAREIAAKMIEAYSKAEVDAVYLVVNEFKSVMSPNLVLKKILPVELPAEGGEQIDYIWEQSPKELLSDLLPRYVEMSIYRAMLESLSAYHAARMTAMDAASSNAGDVIQTLTLNLNRVRQASITREIIEIVSGAAAAV
jgi:F-type H+-transporting ATPase subunit gamma